MQSHRKVVDMTDDELIEAGYLGEGANEIITSMVKRTLPDVVDLQVSDLAHTKRMTKRGAMTPSGFGQSPNDLTIPPPPLLTKFNRQYYCNGICAFKFDQHKRVLDVHPDDLTITPPQLLTKFEQQYYYYGVCENPPKLLYRSDLKSNPYPLPTPGTMTFNLPIKKVEGVHDTILPSVWPTVSPMIRALLEKRGISIVYLRPQRFSTLHEDDHKTLGPAVVWIGTPYTNPEIAREASIDIIHIHEDNIVFGAVVEWYEGGDWMYC